MSLVDAFAKEDRTEVKFSQFFALVKQAAQYETVMNAVNCDVPHRFIRETMTGKKEEVPEILEKKRSRSGRCEGGLRRGRVQKDFAGSHRRDQSEVRTGRGRSRTGAGSTGKRAAGNYRRKYSGSSRRNHTGSSRRNHTGSSRKNHPQKVERRMKHGSGRNYLFYRGSSRRHGWPCGLRRTPCEPE